MNQKLRGSTDVSQLSFIIVIAIYATYIMQVWVPYSCIPAPYLFQKLYQF